MKSKTRLMHTCPTERPFYCITGDLTGEGFLVEVDTRTHELLVTREAEGTVAVRVNPKGVEVKGPAVRPGTRMLEIPAAPSDPFERAEESIERLRRGSMRKVLSGEEN